MRKILLIEDVFTRQKSFMKDQDFKLEEYTDILDNAVGASYLKIEKSVMDDNFDFSEYAVIMVHGSAFGEDVARCLETLKQYCENFETPLVLFSGGALNYYNNTKYEYLELNSKDFYSHNLKVFLDAYRQNKYNVLMLSYGEQWILNILLNVLEKTNIFLEKDSAEDIVYNQYESFTKKNMLDSLNHNFYDITIENGWVYRKDIIALKNAIAKYIKEVSNV